MATPIFICGAPRSGTTLLISLLDSHSQLLVFPEETLFRNICTDYPTPEAQVDALFTKTNVKYLNPRQEVREADRLGGVGKVDYEGFAFETLWMTVKQRFLASERKASDLLDALMLTYGELTDQAGKRYYVEKTPRNETRIHRFTAWWDNPRFIYMVRDPRAAYLSKREKQFRVQLPYTVEEFVHGWATSVHSWITQTANYPVSLLIRYEDLVDDREATLRRICRFLEIDFEPILLRQTKNAGDWIGISSSQEPVYNAQQTLGQKWQQVLSKREVELIETCLGKIMVLLNYRLTRPLPSFGTVLRLISRRRETRKLWGTLYRLYRP